MHAAGDYRIGISAAEAVRMRDVNVGGTERVLDAAVEAGVGRIVYVSTVNVFGNTKGRVVDESYERPLDDGFLSVYDETKYAAHQVAVERAGRGAPVIVVAAGRGLRARRRVAARRAVAPRPARKVAVCDVR